jgi:hypothetical protein
MKRTVIALASGLLALSCIPARAADDALCDRYAAEAVSAEAQEAARRCGYSGPAWGTDPVRHYNGHLNWCLASRNETVEREAQNRRDAIGKCSTCATYAQTAIDDIQKQDKLFCGNPGGPRWDPNRDSHLKWCLAAGFEDIDTGTYTTRKAHDLENVTREAFVGNCDRCGAYASEAIRQQRENVDNKCGFTGPRWSTHQGGHKSWCIESGFAQIGPDYSRQPAKDIEQQERDQALNACKQCREYARTAAAQSKIAKACFPLRGPHWSIHEDTHYRTCMAFDGGTRTADVTREADARTKMVGECKVGVVARPTNAAKSSAGAAQGVSGKSRASAATARRGSGGGNADRIKPSSPRRAPANVMSPGLLEDDTGLGAQGPAGAGAAAAGGAGTAGSSARAGGSGIGVSTFRSPSNVIVAPPAGGGLR